MSTALRQRTFDNEEDMFSWMARAVDAGVLEEDKAAEMCARALPEFDRGGTVTITLAWYSAN